VQTFRKALNDMPLPTRFAVIGALVFGIAGGIAGLILGLRAYPPTAWFAVAEVGLPAAVLGFLAGFVVGVLVLAVRHTRRRPAS
jgi:membrane associated rhomboid family serine protease